MCWFPFVPREAQQPLIYSWEVGLFASIVLLLHSCANQPKLLSTTTRVLFTEEQGPMFYPHLLIEAVEPWLSCLAQF